jgi:hypothetical protein
MTVTMADARGTATQRERPGINIPVLLDGTWSDTNTNVGQICGRVPRDGAGLVQERCYIEGVGTGPFDRIRGGLFGQGLERFSAGPIATSRSTTAPTTTAST